ncbi:MAG: phosphoglycerate dehydrogenase [Terrimicrobiaceae bacterium]
MSRRVLVTPRSVTRAGHPASLGKLEARGFEVVFCTPGVQPSEDELCRLVPDCEGYLAGVEPVTTRVLAAAKKLKAISRNGTGVDSIDLAAAESCGIKVLRAEGANARGVAELAFSMILALSRNLTANDRSMKASGWSRTAGSELDGKILGLFGFGRIGRLVARFALAFDMRVLVSDPYAQGSENVEFVEAEEIIRQADIISLHCPPSAGGGPILDAERIGRLKKGVILINTARSGLIDANALIQALNDGRVGGLGLDVFASEPPVDRRLAEHPKVIATPHVGGFTPESIDRAMTIAVDNLLEALG